MGGIKHTSNKYRKAHMAPPSTIISVGIVVIKLRLRTCVPNQQLNIYLQNKQIECYMQKADKGSAMGLLPAATCTSIVDLR